MNVNELTKRWPERERLAPALKRRGCCQCSGKTSGECCLETPGLAHDGVGYTKKMSLRIVVYGSLVLSLVVVYVYLTYFEII